MSSVTFRSAFVLTLAAASLSASAVGIVSPSANATTEGNGANLYPFFNNTSNTPSPIRYQQVFGASDFLSLGGPMLLTSVAFRPDSLASAGSFAFSGSLTLSTTTRVEGGLDSGFNANVGANPTTVFSGATTLSTTLTPAANGTYAFDVLIGFSNPFVYDPSKGNLLLDFSIAAQPIGTAPIPFDSTNVSGDGTSRVYYPGGTAASVPLADTQGLVARFNAQPVPEPSAFAALGLGLVAVLRRRRK